MPFSLGSNHDKHYTCKCGQLTRAELAREHKKNWSCEICQQPFMIFMDDGDGHSYTVTRHKAKDVEVGATLVHRNGSIMTSGEVSQSNPYGSNPANWYIYVLGYGYGTPLADDYVNVEYNSFVNVVFDHP